MMSTPLTRGLTRCLWMRSALTNLQSGLTFSLFPPRRLSALMTSCPDSMSLSTNQEPMNPAPPVTSTLFDSKRFRFPRSQFSRHIGTRPTLKKCSVQANCQRHMIARRSISCPTVTRPSSFDSGARVEYHPVMNRALGRVDDAHYRSLVVLISSH